MGKTRDLFKKIRDTKGTFHAKMGSIKDRNGKDLTEAEDIKKRWQEYTEELYKKDLHDQDNHNGLITHLEPDILECEVKWALGSITMNKASGGDGITVELFQILKDDAVKVLHSICQQIWTTQQWPQDWKRSVFIPIPEKWVKSLSHVRLFATPWTVAHQAPPSTGFSRQEYWSGVPFPSPGDLPNPGIEPGSPALLADALTTELPENLKERQCQRMLKLPHSCTHLTC